MPVVSGLTAQLQNIFPDSPRLAIDKAVASGLLRALGDEGFDLQDVTCNRDYSRLCPEGGSVGSEQLLSEGWLMRR